MADDALAELVFHVQQLFVFALHEASDGDSGPVGDDFCDGVGVHAVGDHRHRGVVGVRPAVLGFLFVLFGLGDFLLDGGDFAVVDRRGFRKVAFAFVAFCLGAQLVKLLAQVADAVVAVLFGVPACLQPVELFAFVGDFLVQVVEAFLGAVVQSGFGGACLLVVLRVAEQV